MLKVPFWLGNFPAAASSSRAPLLKKSTSQPPALTKPGLWNAGHVSGKRKAGFAISPSPRIQHSDSYIASYCRTLSGITGTLTDDAVLPEGPGALTQVIGRAAVKYLTAHGYTAVSQQTVAQTYTQFNGKDGFVGFLCGKGMARSEAGYLWDLISDL